MHNNTFPETRFIYSEHQALPITLTKRLLYHAVTVCHYLSREKERTLDPAKIKRIEEWAYVLWIEIGGDRPLMLSKKILHQNYSGDADWGDTVIRLSPRLAPIVEADDRTVCANIGYYNRELALRARGYLLERGLAQQIAVKPSQWVSSGEWEVQAHRLSVDIVLGLALRDLRERSTQVQSGNWVTLSVMSDEEVMVAAARAKADLGFQSQT